MARLLPKVLAATGLVAVAPVAAVFELQINGVISSPVLAAVFSAALSLVAYHAAAALWQRRPGTHDMLFGELMVWGFVGRCINERRISNAVAKLDKTGLWESDSRLSREDRALLLRHMAADLEARDPYTHGHSRRVARYAAMTAEQLGITGPELKRLRTAAVIHDIGKIDTPIEVLCKPGKLDSHEWDLIKRHPVDGERMVELLEDPEISEIVRHHHERLDGSGYPDAIAGDAIPLGARIVAVADTFDAITSSRSYRGARTHKQALDIIDAEAGVKLDADAVDAFRRSYLGRRTFTRWIAISQVADRMMLWLVGDALASGIRLAALSAGTVALGTGVVPALASKRTERTPVVRVAAATYSVPTASGTASTISDLVQVPGVTASVGQAGSRRSAVGANHARRNRTAGSGLKSAAQTSTVAALTRVSQLIAGSVGASGHVHHAYGWHGHGNGKHKGHAYGHTRGKAYGHSSTRHHATHRSRHHVSHHHVRVTHHHAVHHITKHPTTTTPAPSTQPGRHKGN